VFIRFDHIIQIESSLF